MMPEAIDYWIQKINHEEFHFFPEDLKSAMEDVRAFLLGALYSQARETERKKLKQSTQENLRNSEKFIQGWQNCGGAFPAIKE